ncbi:MAG: nitronate monooxygenase [Chloroflexi bacterium]|nr:nitronate monooxygenase [Chloroflexota bacterium]
MSRPVLRTPLCDLLGCEYPIMLAGMGSGGSPPELVAAVSNAGGFGVLGATGFTSEATREVIRKTRHLTDMPFGIDLLLPASLAESPESRSEVLALIQAEYPKHWAFVQGLHKEYNLPAVQDTEEYVSVASSLVREQVDVIIEERVPLFCAALGDPSWVVPKAHAVGMKVLGLAGNARNALRQKASGVDIIVAQGYEAGGHVGRIANFVLVPEVVDAVLPVPVVAAGGIADGRTVAAALCLGAVGVWCGTAFLFSTETTIGRGKQEQLARGTTEEFVVSRSYTGKTSRMYRNTFLQRWEESGLEPLPMPLQGVLVGSFVKAALAASRWDLVNNPAGQVAGRLRELRPARQILEQMVEETVDVLAVLPSRITHGIRSPAH